MISSLARVLLQSVVLCVLMQMLLVSASTIPLPRDINKLEQGRSVSSIESDVPSLSKEQFRREMARQLLDLQEAEAEVINRIRELEAERIALSQRKRSHFSNMCMFNVVSCFKKRK